MYTRSKKTEKRRGYVTTMRFYQWVKHIHIVQTVSQEQRNRYDDSNYILYNWNHMHYLRWFIYLTAQCEIASEKEYSSNLESTINSLVNDWYLASREQYFSLILITCYPNVHSTFIYPTGYFKEILYMYVYINMNEIRTPLSNCDEIIINIETLWIMNI
jgi:hypothetical protein